MPEEDFERVRPQLTNVAVHTRQILHRRDEPIAQVYFPNGGVASVTIATRDGHSVEAATVGHEGVLGVGAVFGKHRTMGETMMQVPDTSAAMMSADAHEGRFELVDVVTGTFIDGPFDGFSAAVAAARLRNVRAIWQQNIDDHGRLLGEPFDCP